MKRREEKGTPSQTTDEDILIGELQPGVAVYATSVLTARHLLTKEDDFVRQQSRFDRQACLNLHFDVAEVTSAMYLDYISSQLMDWSKEEIDALGKIVSSLKERFAHFTLGLPAKLHLIKTTGQEEGYAAYTRYLFACQYGLKPFYEQEF